MDLSTTKSLYEGLPFPQRNPEDERRLLITPISDHLGRVNHFCFNGGEDFSDSFRALVAGGGTGDAAIYLAQQLSERGAGRVVYLDQSLNSMKLAQERAKIRGLSNIDWVNASLLDLNSDEYGKFDYINCVGVIHHLKNPRDGLLALSSVLKPSGALTLMVYGRYGRQDITDLRELFKTYMPACDDKNIINDTKTILSALPPRNSYMRGRSRSFVLDSLFSDLPNMADIFLNPVEATYSTDEIAQLIEDDVGLTLNRFTSYDGDPAIANLQYNPAIYFTDARIIENITKLPMREQWRIAEIMDGSMHLHCVYIGKESVAPASFRDIKNIPYFPTEYEERFVSLLCRSDKPLIKIGLSNGGCVSVSASEITRHFLKLIDGSRSIQEIISEINLTSKHELTLLRELVVLSNLDWILLRNPSVKEFKRRSGHKVLSSTDDKQFDIRYESPTYSTKF
jgi:SAM-dependent methyltransferase